MTTAIPVVLILFNRPEPVARVFAAVRAARPLRLLLIADGPRADHPADRENCAAARAAVAGIDWPCRVSRLYAEENLGCRRRIVSGLDWVFAEEEAAIVLEDDCLPDATFFPYCAELLARYRDDARVMTIGGHRMQGSSTVEGPSYRFSRYPSLWGWAAWRRSWRRFDADLGEWPALAATDWIERLFADPRAASYWRLLFNQVRAGFDAWDHAMSFACFRHGALSIHPSVNLVANIGFGADATHTRQPGHPAAKRRARATAFPLVPPPAVAADAAADARIEEWVYGGTWPFLFAQIRARLAAKRVSNDAERDGKA